MIPIQLTYRELSPSDAITAYVQKRADKLGRVFDRITGCRVVVEAASGRHPRQAPRYHVKIELKVPRGEIVVGERPSNGGEDVYACVDESFDDALIALKEHVRKMHPDAPPRERTPHGRVVRIFPGDGYGFIEGNDGTELYFHRNSVLHDAFDRLAVGSVVRYAEELGERGPQASTVELSR